MKFFKILFLLPFIWFSMAVEAENAMVDPDCIKSEQECQRIANAKELIRQRCIADPEWCKERRDRKRQTVEGRKKLNQQCKVYPEQCDDLTRTFRKQQNQLRKENRKRLKQEQEQWCKDNQSACEQWEIETKEIRKKCNELRSQLIDKFSDRPRKTW